MRKYKFIIWFECGEGLEQFGSTAKEAYILACAKRINDAKNYHVDSIETESGDHYEIDSSLPIKKINL